MDYTVRMKRFKGKSKNCVMGDVFLAIFCAIFCLALHGNKADITARINTALIQCGIKEKTIKLRKQLYFEKKAA